MNAAAAPPDRRKIILNFEQPLPTKSSSFTYRWFFLFLSYLYIHIHMLSFSFLSSTWLCWIFLCSVFHLALLIFLVIINEIVHRMYFSLHIITLCIAGLLLQESKALDSFREWGRLTFFRRQ
jgi:fatty acid desaturase